MRPLVGEKLHEAMSLHQDLVATLPPTALSLKLPDLPSNTIGSQLWCVAGARESYVNAIRAGQWQGFTCRVTRAGSKDRDRMGAALHETAALANDCLVDSALHWTPERERLLLTLLEHEVQHHGQLIRYLYANRLPFPFSWKHRYSLD